MNYHKLIITILLLLTYSFGFAHNLVPHCNDFTEESHDHSSNHNHHFHSEGEELHDDHIDIAHDDHFDGGLFDFITCLVHESELPEDECSVEHCFTINPSTSSLKINKIQTAIILFAVFQPIAQDEADFLSTSDVEIKYLSPPLEDSPHRGPPFFSC